MQKPYLVGFRMNDKEKVRIIYDLMTNPEYDGKIDDEAMLEFVRAVIVYRGTVNEFFKVNFNIDLDKMKKEKKIDPREAEVMLKKDDGKTFGESR